LLSRVKGYGWRKKRVSLLAVWAIILMAAECAAKIAFPASLAV